METVVVGVGVVVGAAVRTVVTVAEMVEAVAVVAVVGAVVRAVVTVAEADRTLVKKLRRWEEYILDWH